MVVLPLKKKTHAVWTGTQGTEGQGNPEGRSWRCRAQEERQEMSCKSQIKINSIEEVI